MYEALEPNTTWLLPFVLAIVLPTELAIVVTVAVVPAPKLNA